MHRGERKSKLRIAPASNVSSLLRLLQLSCLLIPSPKALSESEIVPFERTT